MNGKGAVLIQIPATFSRITILSTGMVLIFYFKRCFDEYDFQDLPQIMMGSSEGHKSWTAISIHRSNSLRVSVLAKSASLLLVTDENLSGTSGIIVNLDRYNYETNASEISSQICSAMLANKKEQKCFGFHHQVLLNQLCVIFKYFCLPQTDGAFRKRKEMGAYAYKAYCR